MPLAGERIYAEDVNGDWVAYTPAWTATGTAPAIGNGSITGAFTKVGRTVDYKIIMSTGSSSTYGTGAYLWSLPTPAAGGNLPAGSARIVDVSAGATLARQVYMNSGTTVAALAEAGTFVGPTSPMTWASGDFIAIAGSYESAS